MADYGYGPTVSKGPTICGFDSLPAACERAQTWATRWFSADPGRRDWLVYLWKSDGVKSWQKVGELRGYPNGTTITFAVRLTGDDTGRG